MRLMIETWDFPGLASSLGSRPNYGLTWVNVVRASAFSACLTAN